MKSQKKTDLTFKTDEEKFCFATLSKVSRSFAAVIKEINEELRLPICICYLACRGLDTIEDDMTISSEVKEKELLSFASHLGDETWNSCNGYGKDNPDEQVLLEQFHLVNKCYNTLKPGYQQAIYDCVDEMATGMNIFQAKDVDSLEDYDKYCYYVAGLVGVALSRLFHISGLEDSRFENVRHISIAMGYFLQKTNILRDYLEDIEQSPPRIFYPKEIWKNYANKIENFTLPQYRKNAVDCLNHMITNAVEHIPDCLTYLELVKEPSVFRFCAIPQVMAVATLERCYNNENVFTGVVKIRKGEACKLMSKATSFGSVLEIFENYLETMSKKSKDQGPKASTLGMKINVALNEISLHKSKLKKDKKRM